MESIGGGFRYLIHSQRWAGSTGRDTHASCRLRCKTARLCSSPAYPRRKPHSCVLWPVAPGQLHGPSPNAGRAQNTRARGSAGHATGRAHAGLAMCCAGIWGCMRSQDARAEPEPGTGARPGISGHHTQRRLQRGHASGFQPAGGGSCFALLQGIEPTTEPAAGLPGAIHSLLCEIPPAPEPERYIGHVRVCRGAFPCQECLLALHKRPFLRCCFGRVTHRHLARPHQHPARPAVQL